MNRIQSDAISRRLRLSTKAIALACLLTVAALGFLAARVGYRDLETLKTATPIAVITDGNGIVQKVSN